MLIIIDSFLIFRGRRNDGAPRTLLLSLPCDDHIFRCLTLFFYLRLKVPFARPRSRVDQDFRAVQVKATTCVCLLPDLCSNLLFHRRLREEMMRRTTEKTSKGALPVNCLSYSFPRLSSKPLSMPLVSPTLRLLHYHFSDSSFYR